MNPTDITFFGSPDAFRSWLEANHETAPEKWVGYHRRSTGRPSMTWPESVDQALCFGWIDGIRKGLDAERYTIRFTPRRRTSTWSAVNLRRVPELAELGLMRPAGLRAYEERDAGRTRATPTRVSRWSSRPSSRRSSRRTDRRGRGSRPSRRASGAPPHTG